MASLTRFSRTANLLSRKTFEFNNVIRGSFARNFVLPPEKPRSAAATGARFLWICAIVYGPAFYICYHIPDYQNTRNLEE
ncbi:hypothetical protein Phum_PHUM106030 [Pediculus humanus corporis]|uniref:Uncharacterized protein n=1 Tax=Pediculus humanus subsp. corporis TaxID=121224 RepID=E0VD70_PEDHC|nr:uncharacterized protein Phum_PHUM106030 [Pediculus humanus corporis]EEB11326.1 hypothetical protein Phum_PHUM106030 [Pediculus humanus corporis]